MTHADEMLKKAGDQVLEAMTAALETYAVRLCRNGWKMKEAKAELRRYAEEDLQPWMKSTLRTVARIIDQPTAPSHELH